MAKVFSENKGKSPKPLRNGYDHSFQNLLTGDYGYIYPINVEELNPGESIRIIDTVSVRSHPVVFPVQTRIKAYVHYFAVRNRILLSDWENFISGLDPNAQLPFLKWSESQGKRLMCTGSLMDYLGVPTTVAGFVSRVVPFTSRTGFQLISKASSDNFSSVFANSSVFLAYMQDKPIDSQTVISPSTSNSFTYGCFFDYPSGYEFPKKMIGFDNPLENPQSLTGPLCAIPVYRNSSNVFVYGSGEVVNVAYDVDGHFYYIIFSDNFVNFMNSNKLERTPYTFLLCYNTAGLATSTFSSSSLNAVKTVLPYNFESPSQNSVIFPSTGVAVVKDVLDATDDSLISSNRFLSHSGSDPQEPLSALYPRAYEMIYNYYYRNSQNNPYNPTGSKVEYNKFIPTDESGWDTNEYVLRRRNWELDPYTSAVPSPQFGDAPLIGITYTGGDTADFTFEVLDEQQNTVKVKAKMRVDPETGVMTGVQSFDESVPSGNIRNLMDLSTYGISINAIRNANAFQLFKEDTLQHPLRYRDQIYAHFGVNVDYPDVDVPEFIGGTSADLVVSQVTNMSESDNAPLGDIAGKIDAVFQFKHPIKYHAKEHTIIIGVISLVPVPCYSQLLPKRFSRVSLFDFFQRRFGKIGYVPIFRRELFPLQSQDPDDVFGYQRAWYEYMSRQNEIHGDFRTSLSDFVITRVFKDEPQLNESFTLVDPDSVTNIFATDGVQDKYGSSNKFMIQVYHDTSYISIIPKYGRASLE